MYLPTQAPRWSFTMLSRLRPRLCSQIRYNSSLNHFITKSPPTETQDALSDTTFRLAVKDNIATAGLPTSCASAILHPHQSPFEATIVSQLRARGAVVVGKTNMDEFGMGSHSLNSIHGVVHNPLFPPPLAPRSAGGSSGGSAVAVAVGDADVALGTDTGGSVRLPAAYTGVVGFKPSYGMLSRWGVVPYANSLDTVGLLAKDVKKIHHLIFELGLDREHDPNDPTSLSQSSRKRCSQAVGQQHPSRISSYAGSADLSAITIGIPSEYNVEELDPRIRDIWASAARHLQSRGARVVPVSLPTTQHALSAYYVIAPAEASSNLAKYDGVRYGNRAEGSDAGTGDDVLYSKSRGVGFGDEVRRRILLGSYSLSSEAMDNYFLQAQRVRRLVQLDFDRVFKLANPLYDEERPFDLSSMPETISLENKRGPIQVDFLLCPTAPTFPPRIEDIEKQDPVAVYVNDVFTVPGSLAGLPAVSVPARIPGASPSDADGAYVAGLQVIGQYWDDARVLAMGHAIMEDMAQI